MKTKLTFLLVLICFTATAQVRIGVVAGFQSSDIENKDLVVTSRQGNPLAGIMADFGFSKSGFHILSKAVYSPMGYSKSNLPVTDNLGNTFGTIESHRIGYLQVPVYFSYRAQSKTITVGGGLGPFIALKTGDKLKVKNGDQFGNATILPAGVKKINGSLAGVAVNFTTEWSSVLLALHYQQSFNSIYESSQPENHWKVNSFGLSVGYFFNKKKK